MSGAFADIDVSLSDHVATVEIDRPPHNFFDRDLIAQIATAYGELDEDPGCRAVVLASNGRSFCAGANFGTGRDDASGNEEFTEEGFRNTTGLLYREGVRLFESKKPVVGAIQGAAIGGGLGLALTADFRVAAPEARFAANFVKLGIHPGFGLTATLPQLVGQQTANLMFLTRTAHQGGGSPGTRLGGPARALVRAARGRASAGRGDRRECAAGDPLGARHHAPRAGGADRRGHGPRTRRAAAAARHRRRGGKASAPSPSGVPATSRAGKRGPRSRIVGESAWNWATGETTDMDLSNLGVWFFTMGLQHLHAGRRRSKGSLPRLGHVALWHRRSRRVQ